MHIIYNSNYPIQLTQGNCTQQIFTQCRTDDECLVFIAQQNMIGIDAEISAVTAVLTLNCSGPKSKSTKTFQALPVIGEEASMPYHQMLYLTW